MPPDPPRATAIVVAAGRGDRFGRPDKVLLPLAGRPVLAHALDALDAAASVAGIVVVCGGHTAQSVHSLVAANAWSKPVTIVTGGDRRQDSVEAGLAAADAPLVLVHDAARPLAPAWLFDACAAAAAAHGAAVAAAPVVDTLKRVRDHLIDATVPRDNLWAAQTPQAVRTDLLRFAFQEARHRELDVTDEAGLLEAIGRPVAVVPSSPLNLKITRPDDLALAEAILRAGLGLEPPT